MPHPLLLVHDEPARLQALSRILRREGLEVLPAASESEAVALLEREPVDLCIVGQKQEGAVTDLVRRLQAARRGLAVVWLAASPEIAHVVAMLQAGAVDVVGVDDRQAIANAGEAARRRAAGCQTAAEAAGAAAEPVLLGRSPAFREVIDLVERVGPSTATVLIQGESGTGKELVARALWRRSARRTAPLVTVNCAALPEGLMESELFGHERGAFTGAVRAHKGRFELADGGSIFLDEIGDMSPGTQMKVLRVLQEGEFDRVGGTRTQRVDVRVIAATNVDLARAVAERRFREDLYYRLRVIEIRLPPLRERKEDIPLLAEHFGRRYAARNGKVIEGLEPDALGMLLDHDWPGNVRELENAIERAVVLARGPRLGRADFTTELERRRNRLAITFTIGTPLVQIERRMIAETLRYTGGDKTQAASLLGITARTIYRKLERRRQELCGDREADPSPLPEGVGSDTGSASIAASVRGGDPADS
jgi:two-component system response regulator HydG